MSWTEEKDILLMREMAAQGIFQFKTGSKERGNIWQAIASNLNGNKDLFSYVSSRGCRDRFTLISRRYKAKTAEELKSTGGGSEDEPSEYDLLLEELTHLSEESDKRADTEAETAKKKVSAEKKLALEVRKRAMETMGQTSKRSESGESEDVIKERKKRRSGGDTLQWLEKKADRDLKFKELQLEEQRKEREFQQKERKEQMELLQKQIQIQAESQQQHQQQQMMLMQQMMSMMQQQQQQLQLFSSKKDKE